MTTKDCNNCKYKPNETCQHPERKYDEPSLERSDRWNGFCGSEARYFEPKKQETKSEVCIFSGKEERGIF